jgi:hypothetical protein
MFYIFQRGSNHQLDGDFVYLLWYHQ